jgi:2-dehydro-3-deoxyphosphogalactonate aldolase
MSVLLSHLQRMPLIAILRGLTPAEAEPIGAALVEAGFLLIEVPLNSPNPFDSIARLAKALGDHALIGAGTVLTPDDLDRLCDVGGRLVVMPHADATIVTRAKSLGVACVPGFATPSEALQMIGAGADALKLFPAEAASPAVVKSLRAVLAPEIPIVPVGGITAGNLQPWWTAGARGFGIGSALYRPGDSAATVRARACALAAAVAPLTASSTHKVADRASPERWRGSSCEGQNR